MLDGVLKCRFSKVSSLTAEVAESAKNKSFVNSAGSAISAVQKKDFRLKGMAWR
jgi:hypothetical protein